MQLGKLTKSIYGSYGVDAYIFFYNQKIVSSRICHILVLKIINRLCACKKLFEAIVKCCQAFKCAN
jgi:hypothetical protein